MCNRGERFAKGSRDSRAGQPSRTTGPAASPAGPIAILVDKNVGCPGVSKGGNEDAVPR